MSEGEELVTGFTEEDSWIRYWFSLFLLQIGGKTHSLDFRWYSIGLDEIEQK